MPALLQLLLPLLTSLGGGIGGRAALGRLGTTQLAKKFLPSALTAERTLPLLGRASPLGFAGDILGGTAGFGVGSSLVGGTHPEGNDENFAALLRNQQQQPLRLQEDQVQLQNLLEQLRVQGVGGIV